MKCNSCTAEIPPAFVNAIAKNECPGCGEAIMTASDKELMDELKEAMARMPNDPEGLAGWLLSNYSLHKIGSAEPTEFHRKKSAQPKNNKNLSAFLQRAGVNPNVVDSEDRDLESVLTELTAQPAEEPLSAEEIAMLQTAQTGVMVPNARPLRPQEQAEISQVLNKETDNRYVQNQRLERLRKQSDVVNGTSNGPFKRG